jgi:hypothetical protein
MRSERDGINPAVEPSGTGCVECLALGGWWFHLRRCASMRTLEFRHVCPSQSGGPLMLPAWPLTPQRAAK